jgi:LmbE family N-acetylglucosaminyl deacetylase
MTSADVSALGTVLGVWGHPDDEAYLSAGLMAAAAANDQRVVCVTATRGEAGFPDDDPRSVEERMAVREAELAACLDVLGVREHRWLSYPDGGCHQVPAEDAVGKILDVFDEVQPDTVLTFGPEGQTGHVDHIATSLWTTRAFRRAAEPHARLYYATQTPRWNEAVGAVMDLDQIMMVDGMELPATDEADLALWLQLDGRALEQKVEALLSQASQVGPLHRQVGDEMFRVVVRDEFFRAPGEADWPA